MRNWQARLDQLSQQGMLRSMRVVDGQGPKVNINGREALLLCSNNYLGIAEHPALTEAMLVATRQYGTGSGASRLVSGTMPPHAALEERIAFFKGSAAALLFNSGYAANTGILQGLFGPDDVIFSDELNHASIIDGCRLARARTVVYPHCDVAALAELMADEKPQRKGRWLIVTDGVFSMDGDKAPLAELCDLKEEHDALLMVDDAHGTGVLGKGGRGTGEYFDCLDRIDLHMGTFGKALGCAGAYLAAEQVVINTLINNSRAFIFSTSLPPGIPAAAMAAFDLIDSEEGHLLRNKLEANRKQLAGLLTAGGMDLLGSTTQIIPVLSKDPEPTMKMTVRLLENGIFLQGIRPPTVAPGLCRLRATVMASHEPADLERAAKKILTVHKELSG
ncbi:8-amino-7-oxononanoate synthase [Deltaproteobacteria bacterium IMCC39524]|nr:8-amino-7-oxononanoate synthase [Deltaproteobacteria bacterium IMCC39524]